MTARENLHYFLAQDFRDRQPPCVLDETDWQDTIALAYATKTLGLLERGAARSGLDIPSGPKDQLSAYRRQILQINLRNMQLIAEIAAKYLAANIPFLVLKGTFRAEQVYGSADLRYGADIDLLVRKVDYRDSIAALEELDYRCLVPSDDRWWHDFLGEAPFRRKDDSGPAIDLHNQIQQPGGPYPTHLDDFFQLAEHREIGRLAIPIPRRSHAMMITAISFGKALRASEPWIQYAHEFVSAWRQLGPAERQDLHHCAASMGLGRLFAQCAASSLSLFDPGAEQVSALKSGEFARQLRSAFGEQSLGLMGRTRATWRWMPGGFIQRTRQFGAAMIHELRSRAACRNSPELEFS